MLKHKRNKKFDDQHVSLEDTSNHLGLVYKMAKWAMIRWGGEFESWIGQAWIALHDSIRTFDPKKGHRFSTHAFTGMKWRMMTSRNVSLGRKRLANGTFAELKTKALVDWDKGEEHTIHIHEPPVWWGELTEREQEIVTLRARDLTLQEVGDNTGLTRERVRQILKKVENKLRELGVSDVA